MICSEKNQNRYVGCFFGDEGLQSSFPNYKTPQDLLCVLSSDFVASLLKEDDL